MSISKRAPNTIHLGGEVTIVADIPAIETITPGMLVEVHDNAGAIAYGVHDSADTPATRAVALEQIMQNKLISDTYAAGDLMRVGVMHPGSQFLAIIPSGQTITQGAVLQSNGDGKLKAVGSGFGAYVAVESVTALADSRIRVEVL